MNSKNHHQTPNSRRRERVAMAEASGNHYRQLSAQYAQHPYITAEAEAVAMDYYQTGTIAASCAIRAKHAEAGDKTLTAVQNDRHADTRAAHALISAAALMVKAAQLRDEAKAVKAGASATPDTIAAQANARGEAMTYNEAKAWRDEQHTKAAAMIAEAQAAEDTAKALTSPSRAAATIGEFLPLSHEAIVGRLTAEQMQGPIHSNRIQTAEAVSPDSFTAAYNGIIYRDACNTAGAAIRSEKKHGAHNRLKEYKTLATAEMLGSWRAIHGENSGKAYKVYTGRDNSNYYTMEYREYKKFPTGWYLVYHVRTTAAHISIEAWTEQSHEAEAQAAAAVPEMVSNKYNPAVENQEAAERIKAWIEAANLTDRERRFLSYFINPESGAAKAGQDAVNAAFATYHAARVAQEEAKAARNTYNTIKAAHKPHAINTTWREAAKLEQAKADMLIAEAAAKAAQTEADKLTKGAMYAMEDEAATVPQIIESIRYRAMIAQSCQHIDIASTTGRTTFFNRLKTRLLEAARIEQGCITPEEAAEAEAKALERMQKNSTRGRNNAEAVQVLFVGIDPSEAIQRAAAGIIGKASRKRATKADKARAAKAAEAIKPTATSWTPGEAMTARYAAIIPAYVDREGVHHAERRVTWNEAVKLREATRAAEAINPGIDYRAAEIEARAAAIDQRATRAAIEAANGYTDSRRRREYREELSRAEHAKPAAISEIIPGRGWTTRAAKDAKAAALAIWDSMGEAIQTATLIAAGMQAREAREAAERTARLAFIEALAATVEAADKANPGKTYTAAELEAMRAEAKARAAKHDHITSEARAAERAAAQRANSRHTAKATEAAAVVIPINQAWSKTK